MTDNNQNAENNTRNNKLIQIIANLADSYPDFLRLNVASCEIFYIIDCSSSLFWRRVKLGRFLKTYRDLGFSIFLEMKKDGSNFDREIRNLKICMNKRVVETNIQNNEILRAEADYLDIEEVAIEHIRSIHNLHTDEEYKRILERTKDNGKRLTAKMLMDEYMKDKSPCKSEIFRSLRKKIVIDTHGFFWNKILAELIQFNIQGILDLSNNEIESIDEEFMKICALKIDLRGNKLSKVPKQFENCNHAILDYDTEQTHLSPEVQALRDLYRRKNPINMKNIRNLKLKTTFRDDVLGNVSRLVGYNNIEDCDTMNIIINAHDQSEYSEFREIYRIRHRGPTDMELEDERKTEHSLKKDFSPYFMCN